MICKSFIIYRQSYDVNIMLTVEGSTQVFTNTLDLKNPFFRYNGATATPPGNFNESPTEYFITNYANTHFATNPDDSTAATTQPTPQHATTGHSHTTTTGTTGTTTTTPSSGPAKQVTVQTKPSKGKISRFIHFFVLLLLFS